MIKHNFAANGYKIYTDGGWNNQTNTIYELLYGEDTTKYQATGAICLVKEDELPYDIKDIITIHLTNKNKIPLTSAYPTELISMILALHLAKQIRPIEICTDSDSVKQIIDKKKKLKKILLKDYSILLQHLYHIIDSDKTKNLITFQRAHMDEVHTEEELTPNEWGNVLADKIASNDIEYVRSRCKNSIHFTIDFQTLFNKTLNHGYLRIWLMKTSWFTLHL
jgi:ribonuclease HI